MTMAKTMTARRFVMHCALAFGLASLMPDGNEDRGTSPAAGPPSLAPARALSAVPAPTLLRPGYHLPVTAVPPVPADLLRSAPPSSSAVIAAAMAPARRCPVEVRAVVTGGASDDESFAVIHGGADSFVLRRGDTAQTATGSVQLKSIHRGGVVVRHGGTTYRCALSE